MGKWKGYFGDNIITGAKNAVGVDKIKNNFDEMKKDLNHLIEGAKGNLEVENKNMTFEQMVEKYDLNDDKLNYQYKINYVSFYIMLILAIIAFGLFFYYCLNGSIMPAITSFVIMGVPIAKMFEASINCYRIKKKHFSTVKEWHTDKAYFPEKLIKK